MKLTNVQTDLDEWLRVMESKSKYVKRYGALLPTQEALLRGLYDGLSKSNVSVLTFTAPPGSGKTHVISLAADFLANLGKATCIVVPNMELTLDFQKERRNLVKANRSVAILTLASYVRRIREFDVCLIDESHNLKSSIELDSDQVSTFSFLPSSPEMNAIFGKYLNRRNFVARSVAGEDLSDILRRLSRIADHGIKARALLRQLSSWTGYLIATRYWGELCLMRADRTSFTLVPRELLILFSATPLRKDELSFYCGLNPEAIYDCPSVRRTHYEQRGPAARFLAFNRPVSERVKGVILLRLLRNCPYRSLVLLNNSRQAENYCSVLKQAGLRNRITYVPTGTLPVKRVTKYRGYLDRPNGILITASSVYWEGMNIPDVRLLAIPNQPYPRPTLLDIESGRRFSEQRTVKQRLIQGMGRIGRQKGQQSLGVLMFTAKLSNVTYVNPMSTMKIAARFFS
jgi:Rad3-related DNA helicase